MKKYTVCIVGGGSRYTPDMLAMLTKLTRDLSRYNAVKYIE